MASEALVTDQMAERHVEEAKLANDIKDVTKESCPEPKDLEGKDEEKIKVEDLAAEEASVTESKVAIVSQEKLEYSKNEPRAEEVKIDCPVIENSKGKDEKTISVEDSEVRDASEEKQEDGKRVCVTEEVKKEEVEDEISKQEVGSSTPESKEEVVSSAAVEQTVEAVSAEPAKQSIEASAEDLEATLVKESGSETAKEPTILEAVAEEVDTTKELPQVSSEPVTEPPIASEPVTEVKETEPPIDSKDEPLVTDSNKQEVSGNVFETPIKELEEGGEGGVVTEEVPNVPELEKVDPSVSIAPNLVAESVESLVKVEDKVEEMQEEAVVAEEPPVAATAKADEEEKDESLEGKNTSSVETSRDINVQEKNNVSTEADILVSKTTEKDDEKTPVEPAKDIGDAPKIEVRSKSSHRQSNSVFSKVMQSIVKVKKAIIGKSPSSKSISSKAKDEVKVK